MTMPRRRSQFFRTQTRAAGSGLNSLRSRPFGDDNHLFGCVAQFDMRKQSRLGANTTQLGNHLDIEAHTSAIQIVRRLFPARAQIGVMNTPKQLEYWWQGEPSSSSGQVSVIHPSLNDLRLRSADPAEQASHRDRVWNTLLIPSARTGTPLASIFSAMSPRLVRENDLVLKPQGIHFRKKPIQHRFGPARREIRNKCRTLIIECARPQTLWVEGGLGGLDPAAGTQSH